MIEFNMQGGFYVALSFLEKLLKSEPSNDKAKEIYLNVIDGNMASLVFTEPLSEEWLQCLDHSGFFDAPPSDKVEGSDSSLWYSANSWPALHLLQVNASVTPELVWSLMKRLAGRMSDSLTSSFTELVLGPLSKYVVEWTELETKRIRNSEYLYWGATKSLELVHKLLDLGNLPEALSLLDAMLSLRTVEREPHKKAEIKMLEHEYQQVADTVVDNFVSEGTTALKLLTKVIADSLEMDGYGLEKPFDSSDIWCEHLEEEHDYGTDAHKILVPYAFRAALKIFDNKELRSVVIEHLWGLEWLIFKRIAFRVLAETCEPTDELLLNRLNEVVRTGEKSRLHFLPEYWTALKLAFEAFDDPVKESHLKWVEKYPDIERYLNRFEEGEDKPTKEQLALLVASRRLKLLDKVKDCLPEKWAKELPKWELRTQKMVNESNSIDDLYTIGDLDGMTVKEIVKRLAKWEPRQYPSRDWEAVELSREISRDVASSEKRTAEYFERLDDFGKMREPSWFWPLIEGFAKSKLDNNQWKIAIGFCEELIQYSSNYQKARARKFPDSRFPQNMNWTWREVVRLLDSGMSTKDSVGSIPVEYEERVFGILHTLATNSYFEDMEPFSRDVDYASDAMNNLQSCALEAMFKYGSWRIRTQFPDESERKDGQCYQKYIPKVFATFDELLENKDEQPLHVHSVFGNRLHSLIIFDEKWVRKNLSKIFPDDNEGQRLAAWGAFIKYTPSYGSIYAVVADLLMWAVERLNPEDDDEYATRIDSRLAEHLSVMYWRGCKEPDSRLDGPLIQTFFQNASDALRATFVRLLANNFPEKDDEDTEVITDRLMKLWEWRAYITSAETVNEQEMKEFLGFFTGFVLALDEKTVSENGDASKLLTLVLACIRIGRPRIHLHDMPLIDALNRFSHPANPHLKSVIELLSLLIDDTDIHTLAHSIQTASKLIEAAASGQADAETNEVCFKLIHKLGSLGIVNEGYRALLPVEQGGSPTK